MRLYLLAALTMLPAMTAVRSQEIVEVPASQSGVALPEDMFGLPPGQWFVAQQVTQGNTPCTAEACEAGLNVGNLVVSAEHSGKFVQVIAGFRGCAAVAFNEVETGTTPGKARRREVSNMINKAVKAAEKSCNLKAPSVPKLDVSALFPTGAR